MGGIPGLGRRAALSRVCWFRFRGGTGIWVVVGQDFAGQGAFGLGLDE